MTRPELRKRARDLRLRLDAAARHIDTVRRTLVPYLRTGRADPDLMRDAIRDALAIAALELHDAYRFAAGTDDERAIAQLGGEHVLARAEALAAFTRLERRP